MNRTKGSHCEKRFHWSVSRSQSAKRIWVKAFIWNTSEPDRYSIPQVAGFPFIDTSFTRRPDKSKNRVHERMLFGRGAHQMCDLVHYSRSDCSNAERLSTCGVFHEWFHHAHLIHHPLSNWSAHACPTNYIRRRGGPVCMLSDSEILRYVPTFILFTRRVSVCVCSVHTYKQNTPILTIEGHLHSSIL